MARDPAAARLVGIPPETMCPEITPSPQILERVADRDADWGAAD